MIQIVDCCAHVFPQKPVLEWLIRNPQFGPILTLFRRNFRQTLRPLSDPLHRIQVKIRHFPTQARKQIERVGALIPLSQLLLESSRSDLLESLDKTLVDYALVQSVSGLEKNDWLLDLAEKEKKLLPVVQIPTNISQPLVLLKKYSERGAKAVRINFSREKENLNSFRYRRLLRAASDLALPVVLPTISGHPLEDFLNSQTRPKLQDFTPWFKTYKELPFIISNMNFHEPDIALDLAERFPNLWLGTAWQPTEVIVEAVRRLGHKRLLFASGWPFLGENLRISLERVQAGVSSYFYSDDEAYEILAGNAVRLFNLS